MVATIRPVLPSMLSSSAAADGGEVHGEVTLSTYGEASRRPTISAPAAVAPALVAPAGSVTVISSDWSLWPNFSISSRAACADSELGS